MAFSTGSTEGSGFSSEINITPLIDVLLVLLIIFMVIVPVIPSGLAASLPSTGRSNLVDNASDRPVMVQVELRSSRVVYRINGDEIEKDQIGSRLVNLVSRQTTRRMFLTADAGLDFGVIAGVIDTGQAAGIEALGLVTPDIRPSAR